MDAYCACDAYPIRHDPGWHADGDDAAARAAGGREPRSGWDSPDWCGCPCHGCDGERPHVNCVNQHDARPACPACRFIGLDYCDTYCFDND